MSKFLGYWLVFLLLPCIAPAQPETNKVQNFVTLFKHLYSNETQNYITDGERIVWVKFYKKWTSDDLAILKKENRSASLFLLKMSQHNRSDVLSQLMPDYYQSNGGVKTFSDDILRILPENKSSPPDKSP